MKMKKKKKKKSILNFTGACVVQSTLVRHYLSYFLL